MPAKLPKGAAKVKAQYPAIWKAYEELGGACATAGPIEEKALRLVKLALVPLHRDYDGFNRIRSAPAAVLDR